MTAGSMMGAAVGHGPGAESIGLGFRVGETLVCSVWFGTRV